MILFLSNSGDLLATMVMYPIGLALSVAAELFWVFLNCRKPCPEPCYGSSMAKLMVLACNASACEYNQYLWWKRMCSNV